MDVAAQRIRRLTLLRCFYSRCEAYNLALISSLKITELKVPIHAKSRLENSVL